MKSFGLRGDFGESRLLSDVRILKRRFLPLRHKTSKDPTSSVGLEFFWQFVFSNIVSSTSSLLFIFFHVQSTFFIWAPLSWWW
jgi:hypothetical protein